MTEFKFNSPWF